MRDKKGRFVKGTSGCKGLKLPRQVGHVRDLARTHTEAAIATLASIMLDESKQDRARVAAAESLLDRAWGKPTQPLDHQGEAFHLVLNLGGPPKD